MKVQLSNRWSLSVTAGIAVVFGVLTIVSGGRVLFGGAAAQAAAGNTVPFVLWFNFLSGFAYVGTGVGILMGRGWAAMMAITLAVAIAAVLVLFGLYVFWGGAFEMRTVGAMALRLVVWVTIAVWARKTLV